MNIIKNLIPMNKRQWCWMTSINRSWPTSATIYCYLHISNNIPFTKPICIHFQFGRWSLLAVGVLYGAYHQQRLVKKEIIIQDLEAKKKVIRDAQLVIERKRSAEGTHALHTFDKNKQTKKIIDYIMPNILYQLSIFRGSKSHRRNIPPHIKELDFK